MQRVSNLGADHTSHDAHVEIQSNKDRAAHILHCVVDVFLAEFWEDKTREALEGRLKLLSECAFVKGPPG